MLQNLPTAIREVLDQCSRTGAWTGSEIERLDQKNFMGDTPLHTVASWGDPHAVSVLVAAGAPVNAIGDRGCTPLFNAVIGESLEVIDVLLKAGANPRQQNDDGKTAADLARNFGLTKIAERLK